MEGDKNMRNVDHEHDSMFLSMQDDAHACHLLS